MKITQNKNFRFLLKFCCGTTFALTPVLFVALLVTKNAYFTLQQKSTVLQQQIKEEKLRSAEITLQFTKNQNHKKILDLHARYAPQLQYITSKNIITEEEIELL